MLYDAQQNSLKQRFRSRGAVLDCCFSDNTHGFSGGLDKDVKMYDLNAGTDAKLGAHDEAVKCIEYSSSIGCVLSGGWDSKLKVWDPRAYNMVSSIKLPDKVYTMAVANNRFIVGTANRHVWIFDLRNMSQPEQQRQSSLKYPTRCINCSPTGTGYVLSSTEGRVAVEYFDPASEGKKYAFKCHRQKINGVDHVYPINAIAFHPIHGTFATGGCDNFVYIWDGENKKRISQLKPFPTSVSALDFNHDGSLLAVASSYTFEEGEKDHPPDQIFVRAIIDSDVKPKPRA